MDLVKLPLLKVLSEAHQLELMFPSEAVFFVDIVRSLLRKNPQRKGRSSAAGGQRAIAGEPDALKLLIWQLGNEADRS